MHAADVPVLALDKGLAANVQARAFERRLGGSGRPSDLEDWLKKTREFGIGLLRGLTVDANLPMTPDTLNAAPPTPAADAIVEFVGSLFGTLYTLGSKRQHGHIHDVFFVEEDAHTQLGTGMSQLEWHVEDGCHSLRPHWVIIYCLRGASDAMTSFARAQDFRLTDSERHVLTTTDIELRLDESFAVESEQVFVVRTLSNADPQKAEIIYDPAFMSSKDEASAAVTRIVDREARLNRIDLTLEDGDLVVFNNRRLIHARTTYEPQLNGHGRWIKRALISEADLPQLGFEDAVVPLD